MDVVMKGRKDVCKAVQATISVLNKRLKPVFLAEVNPRPLGLQNSSPGSSLVVQQEGLSKIWKPSSEPSKYSFTVAVEISNSSDGDMELLSSPFK